jgi:hypothetical protein
VTLELITVVSLMVAVVMTGVAWRVVRKERARSAARVAALSAEILDAGPTDDLPLGYGARSVTLTPMFATDTPAPGSRFLMATVIVLIGSAIGAALVVFGTPAPRGAAIPAVTIAASQPPVRQSLPLELIALGHAREADSLVVRGVLRNPSNGAEVDALTAVVVLLNHDGGQVASGRAAVEATTLLPGGETAFVVTVPGGANVERYRVSFRNDDRVVPHVDRRS